MTILMKEFEEDLEKLLIMKKEYEQMKDKVKEYGYSQKIGQPMNKSIGVYMCETI
ncbi:hypothetical protein GOQ29_01010 [Clostridium sp. D2Q-14]|uniref:hypothetical protein n=1 Tax=Anaeromonas gelatinilytica TaxID=2683194 RepID=UPI00193B8F5B|nr:hypothetical protein [Anaeromonas gelatinilytica]MBS4534191.1 hypothetical protein [Anaeromonas gelatinilytica]